MSTATTECPYTESRLDDDWVWYGPLFDEYDWFLDTTTKRIYHTSGCSQTKEAVTLAVPGIITDNKPDSETTRQTLEHVSAPTASSSAWLHEQQDTPETVTLGSIAAVAGRLESGTLLPLPTTHSILLADGSLSVTDSTIAYQPTHDADTDYHLADIHTNTSQLRPVDRRSPPESPTFGETPCVYIAPHASVSVDDLSPITEQTTQTDTQKTTPGQTLPDYESPSQPTRPTRADTTVSSNTLTTTDAVDGLAQLQDESVQLACFSPPYNIGKDYGQSSDNKPISGWYNLMETVFKHLFHVLQADGKVVVNIGKSFAETDDAGRQFFYPLAAQIKQIATQTGFDFKDECIWEKNNFHNRGGGALFGSYPYPTNMMITQRHEHILIFRKWVSDDYIETRTRPPKSSAQYQQSAVSKERWRELTQSLWEIGTVTQSESEIGHPAAFPEELAKRTIELYSFRGDTILDPFIGTGTTAVAAKRAGRKYIGFDTNQTYIEHARDRVADATFDAPGYLDSRQTDDDDTQQSLTDY